MGRVLCAIIDPHSSHTMIAWFLLIMLFKPTGILSDGCVFFALKKNSQKYNFYIYFK